MLKLILFLDFIFLIFLLNIKKRNKYRAFGFIAFFVVLFFVSSYFIPADDFDINVYYDQMNIYREYGFFTGYLKGAYADYPIISLFFYLCSFFPDQYLSGIAAVITYGVITYLLCKVNLASKNGYLLFIMYILVCINYLSVINGIRNMLCYALLALALYYYNNGFNYRSIVCLMLSLGIHSSALLLILIYFIGKHANIKYLVIIFAFILCLNLFPDLFVPIENIPLVGGLFYRFRVYISESININSIFIYNLSLLLFGALFCVIYKKEKSIIGVDLLRGIFLVLPIILFFGNTIIGRIITFIPFYNLSLCSDYLMLRDINVKLKHLIFLYLILCFCFTCYTSYSSMILGGPLW